MILYSKLDKEKDIEPFMKCADKFILYHLDDDFYDEGWVDRTFLEKVARGKTTIDTFVAKEEQNVVGFIMGSKYMPLFYEIRNHFILPEYRNKGIGTNLKMLLTAYAGQEGYRMMVSDVSKNNPSSMRLNEKLGWTRKSLDEETWRYYYHIK